MKQKLLILGIISMIFFGGISAYAGTWESVLVKHMLQAHNQQAPRWELLLKQIETQFNQLVVYQPDTFPTMYQEDLLATQKQLFYQRLFYVQKRINQHVLLKKYSFAAPYPQDLCTLSQERLNTLVTFLQESPSSAKTVVARAKRVRPFTLALELGTPGNDLEIWIDRPSKRIYLMSDNFYTTQHAKYTPHLH